MMPTARQLEIFLAVVDKGSIRSAADHLDVSQPSVSKQILALERKTGARLFERNRGSKAIPTDAGNDLIALARQALEVQKKFLPDNTPRPFPKKIVVMMRQHLYAEITPWIEERKLTGRSTEIHFEILRDEIDVLSLLLHFPDRVVLARTLNTQSEAGVSSRLLARDKCSLYASPACINVHGGEDSHLNKFPVLIPSSGFLMRWHIDHLRLAGIAPEQMAPSPPFTSVILRHTLEGRGASLLMDSHVSDHVKRGELIPLLGDIASLYLQFLWHPSMDPVLAGELYSAFAAVRSIPATSIPNSGPPGRA